MPHKAGTIQKGAEGKIKSCERENKNREKKERGEHTLAKKERGQISTGTAWEESCQTSRKGRVISKGNEIKRST